MKRGNRTGFRLFGAEGWTADPNRRGVAHSAQLIGTTTQSNVR